MADSHSSLTTPNTSSRFTQRARSRSTRRELSSGGSQNEQEQRHSNLSADALVAGSAIVPAAEESLTNTSLLAELQPVDDLRYPAHLVGQERGRLLPQQHVYSGTHLQQQTHNSTNTHLPTIQHTLASPLQATSEEAYQEDKNWQSSPTLTPSPRESFEEEPKLYYQHKGQFYPMAYQAYNHHAGLQSPPIGAAAPAYPSNRGNAIPAVPLINNIKNEWQRSTSHARSKSDGTYQRDRPHLGALLRRIFRRRTVIILLVLVAGIWAFIRYLGQPYAERSRLRASLKERLKEEKGYFGVNQRVGFFNMHQVVEIERWKVPGSGESKDGQSANERRLIVVGDIHGCIDELRALMEKVDFDDTRDELVTAGDMVSRGPDSAAVVSYLIDQKASCVRGNHEDRVLLARRDVDNPSHRKTSYAEDGSVTHKSIKKGAASDLDLAKSLSEAHIEYLKGCPVILDLGDIPGMGPTSVVHAGLVPAVPLTKQDPAAVMSMRSIDLRSHVPSKSPAPKPQLMSNRDRDRSGASFIVPWSDLWNAFQQMIDKKDRSTVLYGHDAKRGIVKEKWSYGLDGNCVRGGKLAALVISGNGRSVQKKLVTVDCADHTALAQKDSVLGDN